MAHAATLESKLQIGRDTRALLEAQAAALRIAANTLTALPETRAQATRYLGKVEARLRRTDFDLYLMAGLYGENGWAPGIRDVCDRAGMYSTAPGAVLDGQPVCAADAAILRRAA